MIFPELGNFVTKVAFGGSLVDDDPSTNYGPTSTPRRRIRTTISRLPHQSQGATPSTSSTSASFIDQKDSSRVIRTTVHRSREHSFLLANFLGASTASSSSSRRNFEVEHEDEGRGWRSDTEVGSRSSSSCLGSEPGSSPTSNRGSPAPQQEPMPHPSRSSRRNKHEHDARRTSSRRAEGQEEQHEGDESRRRTSHNTSAARKSCDAGHEKCLLLFDVKNHSASTCSETSSETTSPRKRSLAEHESDLLDKYPVAEALCAQDPYWQHLLQTFFMNLTLAKSASAIALLKAPVLAPFMALASGTAVIPAPPRPLQRRSEPKVTAGPGSALNAFQQNKEETQFMELIFPGFDGDTFIWNLTLAQIATFGFTMLIGHQKANPTPCALYSLGASWGPALARGQLWRLVCPMMLHANMMHLFFNVFFQLRIGFGMERQFGKSKMRLIYLTCGVIGNLVSVMLDPFKLSVGASTAGFGLIGVWVAEIVMSWEMLGANRDRTLIWILFMLVSVTTMSGMTPNMDLYGHFGGALGGFLMALVMADMKSEHRPPWYNAMKRFGFGGLATVVAAGGWKLLHTPTTPIPDCAAMFPALSHLVDHTMNALPSIFSAVTTTM
ncbi:unnamed protein product [Amoebophrya sp. A25]|nr:unnamed protein product [Amoebophrya sp. A25]|eukprot:GSA25T00018120001.1